MLSLLLKILSGPIIGAVTGVINKHYERAMNRDVLQAEVEKAILGAITDVAKTQGDVIQAEMQSESWLARNWRPMAGLGFVFAALSWSLFIPIATALGAPAPKIDVTLLNRLFDVLTLCLGGYVATHGIKTLADAVLSRWRK